MTTRENRLGDLLNLNKLRKEERMHSLAPYRLQEVIERLEDLYGMENLDSLIKHI